MNWCASIARMGGMSIWPGNTVAGSVWTVLAAVAFLALSGIYLYPAISHFSDGAAAITGTDIYQYLWQLWYFKYALVDVGTNPFNCDLIFYPDGVVTALCPFHTLYGLISTPLQLFGLRSFECYTLLVLFTYAASGFFTYLLARYVGRSRPAAMVAGIIFAFCAYRYGHLLFGQLNLLATEWIPVYAVCLLRLLKAPSTKKGLFLGLAFLAQLLTSYYYAVMLIAFTVIVVLARAGWERRALWKRWFGTLCGTLCLVLLGWALGSSILPSLRFSFATPRSLSVAGWALGAVWLFVFKRPSKMKSLLGETLRPFAIAVGVVVLGFSPLLVSIVPVLLRGCLAAQLSSDVSMSLNPLYLVAPCDGLWLWSGLVKRLPAAFSARTIESLTYIGSAAMVLLLVSALAGRKQRENRFWLVCALLLMGLMLGDTLRLRPDKRWLIPASSGDFLLPLWSVFKRIPLLENVRVCSRFGGIFMLCVAVAAAWAADWVMRLVRGRAARAGLAVLLCSVCFVDVFPAGLPIADVSVPEVYTRIGAMKGDFSILEVPPGFGGRSGFVGASDFRIQYNQTVHHKRLLGRVAGGVPRAAILSRWTQPVIGTLLRLWEGRSVGADRLLLDRLWAREFLARYNARVAIVHKYGPVAKYNALVTRYIQQVLGGKFFLSTDSLDAFLLPESGASTIRPDQIIAEPSSCVLRSLRYDASFIGPSGQYNVRISGRLALPKTQVRRVELWYERAKLPVGFQITSEADGTSSFVGWVNLRKRRVGTWGLVNLNYAEVVMMGESPDYIAIDRDARPYLTLKVFTKEGTVPHFFLFDLDPENLGTQTASYQAPSRSGHE